MRNVISYSDIYQKPIRSTLTYETGGRDCRMPDARVVRVRRVVTPKDTLPGTALGSSQKETQEMETMRMVGM